MTERNEQGLPIVHTCVQCDYRSAYVAGHRINCPTLARNKP